MNLVSSPDPWLFATWLVLCSTVCVAATITNCTTQKTPCICKDTAVGVAIDLKEVADILEAKNITVGRDNHLEHHVSLCGPSKYCADNGMKGAAVCQHDLWQNIWTKIGRSDRFSFDVESKTSFSIFYQGGESDVNGLTRQARFAFTVSSSVTDPQVEDVSEDLGNIFPGFHTYTFNVTIAPKEVNPGGGVGPVDVIGLVLIILLIVAALIIIIVVIIGSIILYKIWNHHPPEKNRVTSKSSPSCKRLYHKGPGYQLL